MRKSAKVHLFHPYIGLTPACNPQLTGREFKAVEYGNSNVTCKRCLFLIATQHIKWLKGH